jgi:hypothetical protein
MMAPIVEKMYDEFKGIEMAEVDTDASKPVAAKYEITALPTFVYFHKGQEVERIRGAQPNEVRQSLVKLAAKNPNAQRGGIDGGSTHNGATSGSNAGSGSGPVDSEITKLIPKGYEILNDAVHIGEAEILNVKSSDNAALLRDILSIQDEEGLKYIASDADSQVLIYLPFTNKVKVHSILLYATPVDNDDDTQTPHQIKVWANTTGMISFDDAASGVKALHSGELPAAGSKGWRDIPLRFVHFQNVSSIVIFLDGEDEDISTVVQRLILVGSKGESRDQGKLEKIDMD